MELTRRGRARHGKAWQGEARQGKDICYYPETSGRGQAGRGGARRGKARYGVARVVFDIIIHLSFSAPDIFTAGVFLY